ncbi:hypothetical protein CEUSTIGMA_g11052.t1 [Chlamydomonas eustigma]|uniref:Protein kinase domain-containing protein n=1 Tax=Chlamydomonas eustigma TaxID=1157962 RepID=A0A250XKM9_9CHLO|nr:hypothetical protein CEUSTIGMA_g11052.t1 [Chlamydomonas eustigma]|eukprot:GAX83628.1 hypothetical protein CEUSTIGMA_g11052.t1 [Chlamydomonas eustigma]
MPEVTPLLADLLSYSTSSRVLELRVGDAALLAEEHKLMAYVWQFAPLLEGELTLQAHVERQTSSNTCPGPFAPYVQSTLKFMSTTALQALQLKDLQDAQRPEALAWRNVSTYRQEWKAQIKNLLVGNYDPVVCRGVRYGNGASVNSRSLSIINWPAIIIAEDGSKHWGMVEQVRPCSAAFQEAWCLRDLLAIKHTPACISVVERESGQLLWQNAASMAMFGCHGLFMVCESEDYDFKGLNGKKEATHKPYSPSLQRIQQQQSPAPAALSLRHEGGSDPPASETNHKPDVKMLDENFLMLLLSEEDIKGLEASISKGVTFRCRVEIKNTKLRKCMGLGSSFEEVHHDVQISLSRDPITLKQVLTVSQIDVSETVKAQKQLEEAHAQLAEEKSRMDSLLKRQYDLIACLGLCAEVARSGINNEAAAELIASVQRQITAGEAVPGGEQIQILEDLGSGAYGKVSKGIWRGREVAVKTMVLPTNMSSKESRERMALMEAAISTTLSHPNIVQTYSYSLVPLRCIPSEPTHTGYLEKVQVPDAAFGTSNASINLTPSSLSAYQVLEDLSIQSSGKKKQATSTDSGDSFRRRLDQLESDEPSIDRLLNAVHEAEKDLKLRQKQGRKSRSIPVVPFSQKDGFPKESLPLYPYHPIRQGEPSAIGVGLPDQLERKSFISSHAVANATVTSSGEHAMPALAGFEVKLVLEYCDAGSLRSALMDEVFIDEASGKVDMAAVMSVATGVARGMQHLHQQNIVHADLKPGNILLCSRREIAASTLLRTGSSINQRAAGSSMTDGTHSIPGVGDGMRTASLVAKIADFGLSFKMDMTETHMSSMFQGTVTHMAPEVIVEGCQSKAADVYAYGITLWELYTSSRPFLAVGHAASLPYQVAHCGLRPEWPPDVPAPYAHLAERCWDASPSHRPSFDEILNCLSEMQLELGLPD